MIDLNDIKKETGFKVPDNYFENLNSKILENVSQDNTKKTSSNINRSIIVSIASIAAAIAIIFSVVNNSQTENYNLDLLAEYNSLENVEDYYLEYLDEDEITEFTSTTYNNEDVIDYLLDENIDYELISEDY